MKISVHQPHYLPWLGYFDKIKKSDAFVFLDNVQYKKREFQNRNKIRVSAGSLWLTVPVITKDRYFQKISEVEIDNTVPWAHDHWCSIEQNYAKSPYFSVYKNTLSDIYAQRWDKLIAINVHITRWLLEVFEIKTPVYFETAFSVQTASTQRIVDLCKALKADAYLSGSGGKDYMDETLFADNGIALEYQQFTHPVYTQTYEGFEPYMCALDYLFNCGPRLREG